MTHRYMKSRQPRLTALRILKSQKMRKIPNADLPGVIPGVLKPSTHESSMWKVPASSCEHKSVVQQKLNKRVKTALLGGGGGGVVCVYEDSNDTEPRKVTQMGRLAWPLFWTWKLISVVRDTHLTGVEARASEPGGA